VPNRCAWQRRPLVRLPPEGVAFAAQDDGATAVILAKAPPGTLNDDPSGLHPPALGGMFAVVGATLQVFSVVSRSAKLLLAQEPPTALHEQVHVALAWDGEAAHRPFGAGLLAVDRSEVNHQRRCTMIWSFACMRSKVAGSTV